MTGDTIPAAATIKDDNAKYADLYSIPFAEITPSADGVSLPKMRYLDVDREGKFKDFTDYTDFKGFVDPR